MRVTTRNAGLLACALALGAATMTVNAQGSGYGGGPGYGPGMMGGGPGYGRGYGPRGGYGPGGGNLDSLNLSDEQREKIQAVQEESRQKNWTTMGQVRSETFKLRGMYNSDKLDANALAEQQKKVDALRLQMLASRVASHNQVEAVLTPEQRKQFRQFRPHWLQDGEL